ncbi:MAG: hypothetical protein HY828_08200 [Actinobacteria bacterium]|nr:hypothetical protein [Actinomycetota bacterium]
MPDEQTRDLSTSVGQSRIWLVRSRGQQDGAVAAFWERIDAEAYVAARHAANPGQPAVLSQLEVQGGRRCRLCGEPIVLDDPSDAESWRHADDANDLGDHTAEA